MRKTEKMALQLAILKLGHYASQIGVYIDQASNEEQQERYEKQLADRIEEVMAMVK